MNHAQLRRHARDLHEERLRTITEAADRKEDKKIADHEVKKAIHEHDEQLHDGRRTKLKLRDGGAAEGRASRRRLDRGGRRAHRDAGGALGTNPAAAADASGAGTAMQNAINAGLTKALNPAPAQRLNPQATGAKRGGRRAHGGRTDKGAKGKGAHVNVIVGAPPPHPVSVPVPARGPMPLPPRGAMPPRPMPAMPPGVPPGMVHPGMMPPPGAVNPAMVRRAGGRVPHMEAGAGSGLGRLEKARRGRRRGGDCR